SLAVVVRERTSQNQRIQKSRTRSGKIDRAALRKSETMRHKRRCRREQMIRRACGEKQETDIFRLDSRPLESRATCPDREIRCRFARGGRRPPANAGASFDPAAFQAEAGFDRLIPNDG